MSRAGRTGAGRSRTGPPAVLKVCARAADAHRVTPSRRVAEHATPPRHRPPPAGVLVVAAALVVTAAMIAASAMTSSAWPGVVLPVLATALGVVPVRRRAVAIGVTSLLVGAAVTLAWAGSALAIGGMSAAVAVSAAVVTLWRHQRRRHLRTIDSERARSAELTVVDELTGCYNTHGLSLLGEHVLAMVRRQSGAMHAAVVEVEGIPAVLDALGARAVDEVVLAVSSAVRGATRGTDVVCRSGEVTFVVVGPGSGTGALDLERRLRALLLRTPPLSLREWPCTVLVGVAQLQPWDSGGLSELTHRADEDLGLRRALRGPAIDPRGAQIGSDQRP